MFLLDFVAQDLYHKLPYFVTAIGIGRLDHQHRCKVVVLTCQPYNIKAHWYSIHPTLNVFYCGCKTIRVPSKSSTSISPSLHGNWTFSPKCVVHLQSHIPSDFQWSIMLYMKRSWYCTLILCKTSMIHNKV